MTDDTCPLPEPGERPPTAPIEPGERLLHFYMEPQHSWHAVTGLEAYKPLPWHMGELPRFRAELIQACEDFKPTIVFLQTQKPGVLREEDMKAISDILCRNHWRAGAGTRKPVVVWWSGDVGSTNGAAFLHHWMPKLLPYIDLCLYTSGGSIETLRSLGHKNVGYLQIGVSDSFFHARDRAPSPRFPITFFANKYQRDMLIYLGAAPDDTLRVRCMKEIGTGVPGGFWSKGLDPATTAEHYRNSAMGLSISATSKFAWYSSDRLIRIMACGAAPVVIRFPEMESWGLWHGRNAIIIEPTTDPEDIWRQCREWLKRPTELAEIGRRAAEEHLKHHTWQARLEELAHLLRWARERT